jgi:hypothetical protein
MATPKALQYSTALKPVSIPVAQQTRKFLPTSSGKYNTSNSIIRIPINSNAFLDLKNLVLKFRLKNTSAYKMFLDGNASAIIRRLEVLSPDGQAFETIDNYSRLYNALVDVERSIDNREGYGNLLEGASNDAIKYTVRTTATARQLEFFVNDVSVGTLTLGVVGSLRVGSFLFATTDNSDGVNANTKLIVNGQQINIGTAQNFMINNVSFVSKAVSSGLVTDGAVAPAAGALFVPAQALWIDGQLLTLSATATQGLYATIENKPRIHSALTQSEVFAADEEKTYSIPLLSCITKLDVLYPGFLISGGGVTLQITVPSNEEVFFSVVPSQVPSFEVDGVELIVPVLQYSDTVVQSMKQMVQQLGTFSMSSYTFKNFTYPYKAGGNMSVPLAIRVRSLKAIYFFFQSVQSSSDYSIPRVSARENINLSDYQLRVGSMYYPASKVQMTASNPGEVVVELLKSVSKLNDMRLGTYINKKNFYLSQSQGGLQVFGIDLEGLQNEYMESGLNTSENALQTFLEITCTPASDGNCHVFAFYDNSISILSNGSVIATQ